MIDFTKLRSFPVAPAVEALQGANKALSSENSFLKTALKVGGVIVLSYILYKLYKKHQHDKSTTNQSPRY